MDNELAGLMKLNFFTYLWQLGPMATHPELEKGIWRIIDEDGTVKDSAVSLYYHNLE